MLDDLRSKIISGVPYIAECGGFIYLHDILCGADGNEYKAAGIINGKAFPAGGLKRFGYVTMTAAEDNILCEKGGIVKAHEFHHWESTVPGNGFTAEKTDGRTWECANIGNNFYAGFPHIYFYSDIRIAERFVKICSARREKKHEQDK